jgi:hypothetical protein
MPDHTALLGWIQHTGLSTLIRQSSWAVMAFESVHLIGLVLLGGAAVVAALAALRHEGLRGMSVSALVGGLVPLSRVGLFLMVMSGTLIAVSMPFKYYGNPAFRWKMLLLGLALLTSSVLRWMSRTQRSVSNWRLAPRVVAVAVLVLWIGVGCCGRLIGFL